jgi:branched-chain amino acid transport system substrate-binding protein
MNPGRARLARFLTGLLAIVVIASACAGGEEAAGDVGVGGADTTEDPGEATQTPTSDDPVASGDPIKIGVLLPYTGPFGLYGTPMETALRARFAEVSDIAGRPVELIFEDEATDAGTAVSKATKLVDRDGVVAVVCCATGSATLAVGPLLAGKSIPQLAPIPQPEGLDEFATAAMAAPTSGHDARMLGRHAYDTLGHRTAVLLASDFSYGREVAGSFRAGFEEAGGEVVDDDYPPLGTQDFGSYLSGISSADVVFGGFAGADAVRFVQQYEQFGLKNRMPLVGHGPLVTELVLGNIGEPAMGVGAAFYYSSSLDVAENQRFIDALAEANPEIPPSHFTAGAWASGTVLIEAIERLGGDVADAEALAEAIRAVEVDAPWGRLTFDPKTGYAVAPTYYYEVTKEGDGLRHSVQDVIE